MKCPSCPVPAELPCHVEREPRFAPTYCGEWSKGTAQQRSMIVERSGLPLSDRRVLTAEERATIAATPPAEVDPKAALADVMLAGDVIEAITKATGIKAAVEMWSALTGHACRCNERKEMLNEASRKLLKWAGLDR